MAEEAAALAAGDPSVPAGAVVQLSGCPRACASGHVLSGRPGAADKTSSGTGDDPLVVVVAGELVDGVPTSAADLAPAVIRKLKE